MVHGIPYGLKEGELIHISRAEKGIKCDCICPSCKSALVAKKGSVKKHYFAHYTKNECNYALESSLHLAVKEILEKEKRMVIPEIATGVRYGRDGLPESTLVMSPSEIQFDGVALESKLNDFVPDIILYKNGTPLIVEVYVTHRVDEYKLQKIKKKRYFCNRNKSL
ncbi:competence protein CoiA family protein [Bacillus sp. OTU530]|uniref:competence protein CoiA family protein n=1 Tax=Bacillus sp. OTU530 TaxID=3043862 RepID=UPI00313DA63F